MFAFLIINTNILNWVAESPYHILRKIFREAHLETFSAKQDGNGYPDPMRVPIVIHKDKNTDYGVTVPDLPGCFSAGDTFDDALINAVEAIECHIEGLLIENEPVPTALTIEHHRKKRRYSAGVWALVEVDVSKLSGKAKRVNITLPERLLSQIDSFASKTGETRSGLLAHAAMEYVSGQSKN